MPYADFLSQPYFKEVCLRKLELLTKSPEVSKKIFLGSRKYFDKLFPQEKENIT